MSNPINRLCVGRALGIPGDHHTTDIFKRLVASGFLPAPLDSSYDSWDLTAVAAVVGSGSTIVSAAKKFATEHRGGPKAIF